MNVESHEFREVAENFVKEYYIPSIVRGIESVSRADINFLADDIRRAIQERARIFVFGNGGSFASAQIFRHLLLFGESADLLGRVDVDIPRFTDLIGSDFPAYLQKHARNGDRALLISASGNSQNILETAEMARQMQIKVLSVTGDGALVNAESQPDLPLVVDNRDQQILEDISQYFLYQVVQMVISSSGGDSLDVVFNDCEILDPNMLVEVAESILECFFHGRPVRVFAPDNGLLAIDAEHISHNLQWDVFQDVELGFKLSLAVDVNDLDKNLSDWTGKKNDGAVDFLSSFQALDQGRNGAVFLNFFRDQESLETQNFKRVCEKRKVKTFDFNFEGIESEGIASVVAMAAGHIIGRLTNAKILSALGVIKNVDDLRQHLLRRDLAMLREFRATRASLVNLFV
ncbi:hypothetical protein HN709_01125 [Candidatus Peregrinibacteria bacterium]|nr:hypothetical protein [Candidatus Peregrinibacteria bacterium]MBT7736265.1 hypothetical protein [Candidatus Peregrinibacteria bacterium]